ncbi:19980_t:CDS:2, partial [Racocetra fulgida]
PSINEGSYVCEFLAPLINTIVSDLPLDIESWGSASAERKDSLRRARRPDFSIVVNVNGLKVEIAYLETGRPDSKPSKQARDHKKLRESQEIL